MICVTFSNAKVRLKGIGFCQVSTCEIDHSRNVRVSFNFGSFGERFMTFLAFHCIERKDFRWFRLQSSYVCACLNMFFS